MSAPFVVFDDGGLSTKDMAFATPESWFVDDVNTSRYAGYSQSRSIWQIVDALDPIQNGDEALLMQPLANFTRLLAIPLPVRVAARQWMEPTQTA